MNQATTSDADANIGGGIMLLAGIAVGVLFFNRSREGSLTAGLVALGLVALICVFGLTYGLHALE